MTLNELFEKYKMEWNTPLYVIDGGTIAYDCTRSYLENFCDKKFMQKEVLDFGYERSINKVIIEV